MSMVKFDVDGPNLLLIAKPGVTAVDVQVDLYSDAKEHWIATTDNKYNFPLRTVGGDPKGGGAFLGSYYFLTNGWKIRPQEADHSLLLTGNLFLDDGEVGGIFVPTLGDFTVLATIERTSDATALSGSGGTDWTTTEQQQIRHRLGIDGSASAPAATPSLATAVALLDVFRIMNNRLEIDYAAQELKLYDDAGTAVIKRWPLSTQGGEPVATIAGAQTKRAKPL